MLDLMQDLWQDFFSLLSSAVISSFPWINVILMVIAGCFGSMLCGKIKDPVRDALARALGLFVILMGGMELWNGFFVLQTGQFETMGTMLVVLALPAGYAFGHAFALDRALGKLGVRLFRVFIKEKPRRPAPKTAGQDPALQKPQRDNLPSAEGFMLAAVIGAFGSTSFFATWDSMMTEDALPLLACLGFHMVVFFLLAALYGSNSTFAAIPVLCVELLMLLLYHLLGDVITYTLMNQLRLVGAVILIATGIFMGCGKRVRSAKLIPAYLIPIIFGIVKLLVDKLIESA